MRIATFNSLREFIGVLSAYFSKYHSIVLIQKIHVSSMFVKIHIVISPRYIIKINYFVSTFGSGLHWFWKDWKSKLSNSIPFWIYTGQLQDSLNIMAYSKHPQLHTVNVKFGLRPKSSKCIYTAIPVMAYINNPPRFSSSQFQVLLMINCSASEILKSRRMNNYRLRGATIWSIWTWSATARRWRQRHRRLLKTRSVSGHGGQSDWR